jgi:hypothetical protein
MTRYDVVKKDGDDVAEPAGDGAVEPVVASVKTVETEPFEYR